jgi:hypothetical protein
LTARLWSTGTFSYPFLMLDTSKSSIGEYALWRRGNTVRSRRCPDGRREIMGIHRGIVFHGQGGIKSGCVSSPHNPLFLNLVASPGHSRTSKRPLHPCRSSCKIFTLNEITISVTASHLEMSPCHKFHLVEKRRHRISRPLQGRAQDDGGFRTGSSSFSHVYTPLQRNSEFEPLVMTESQTLSYPLLRPFDQVVFMWRVAR